jgi:hypothetical protein
LTNAPLKTNLYKKGDAMEAGILLGVAAGIVHITAYLLYNTDILKNACSPNNTTWLLWAFLGLLNVSSYVRMSRDLAKSILPITSATLRFTTLFVIIARGKWRKPDKYDLSVLIIGICAAVVWYVYKNAAYANLILQLCYIISIIPTQRGILRNEKNEKILPWLLWGAGHSLGISVVVARWSGQYQDLAFSAIGAMLNFGTGILVAAKKHFSKTP